jgi:predicted Rossmann fold nucleotide-binding protein DprA/Smf involved in DNA uptake
MTGIFFFLATFAVYLAPPLDLVSTTTTALKRDDIIAALSNAVVVVETRSKGGAKYTANVARKKKIPVIVPKISNNDAELQEGFEVLVQEGAHVAKDEDHVIEIIKSLPKSDNHQLDSFL